MKQNPQREPKETAGRGLKIFQTVVQEGVDTVKPTNTKVVELVKSDGLNTKPVNLFKTLASFLS